MKLKRGLSMLITSAMLSAAFGGISTYAAGGINSLADLQAAFGGTFTGEYIIESDIDVTNSGITVDTVIDGGGKTLNSTETRGDATIYQNNNISSEIKNVVINGNTKPEVGIWEGAGTMTISDSVIQNYSVATVRKAAIAVGSSGSGKQGNLILNNVDFLDNSEFDITVSDYASLSINEGTELEKLRLQSTNCTVNIGSGWSGSFEITMDTPTSRVLGTIGEGADISGITVSGDGGYYIANEDGSLAVKNDNGAELYFDMNSRSELYHGSTGFLYGAAEINVPTIDLLRGLKPVTMVQKALGGLQHPTGDAVRTSSAIEAAGVRNIQVYFQDIYLQWPYNAPTLADGSLDVEGYKNTVEQILYGMICDKANEGDTGAFLGNDGNYYVLNKTKAEKYSYVIFNEPDNIWFKNNLDGLKAAWKLVYEAIRAIDPDAKCAGPNFATYNASRYDSFFSYCYTNNCLPEIITWHELSDASLTDFHNNYDTVKSMANKYYTDAYAQKSGRSYQPELLVNEYARYYDIGAPGGIVKWLAMFEEKDINSCMAYWGMANSLNEMAADQNSPASTWWVYHWYAQMTGQQCNMTAPAFESTTFYGAVSYDEDINMAYALFGGNEDKNGKETVYLNNMNSTELVGENGAVNVKIYGVSFSGQHGAEYSPECIFNGAVSVNDNTLTIQITDTDEMDAYFAVITGTDDEGSNMQGVKLSTLTYEAEDAELVGKARAYEKTAKNTFATSGRWDVGNITSNGDGVSFKVDIPEDGLYDVGLFYSLRAPYVNAQTLEPDSGGQNRAIGRTLPFGLQVDGGEVQTLYLDTTVVWTYRAHCNTDIYLTAGEHTLLFTHIYGDESNKGNLQLSAALDKLDLDLIRDVDTRYDFEIDLREHTNFREGDVTKLTVVAPEAGYYNITGDGDFTLTRQSVDYASDAETYSTCSTYDIPVSDTVYLSQGANTIGVSGNAEILHFAYDGDKTQQSKTVVNAEDMAIHGINAYFKESEYSQSGKVVTELGIGQNADEGADAEDNYVEFLVNAPSEGVYNFAIRYSSDEPAPVMRKTDGSTYVHPYNIDLVERYAQIKINDNEPETVYFRNTMSWESFKTVDIQAMLNEGENTVRIYNDNSYQFSELVNSTAPEIDMITISKQSYDGETVTVSSEQGDVDTSELDKIISEAERALLKDSTYSESSLAELRALLDGIDRETQSEINKACLEIKEAINNLKPASVKLSDYYITSYASTSLGIPQNAFDGNVSTVWTASRKDLPYVAYLVFYAGDDKVFNLSEITMQGDGGSKVIYMGTDSDDILKDPIAMNAGGEDLCKKDSDLYRPFADLYGATILGTGAGEKSVTLLEGKYRYLVVGLHTWSVTNVNELSLSALVEKVSGSEAGISINTDNGSAYADIDVKYNNTGKDMYAYFGAYDGNGKLVSIKSEKIDSDFLRLELPASDGYTYKVFIWNDGQTPIQNFVSK